MYDNTASYLRNGLLSQAAVRSGSYDRRKTLRTSIIIIHEHLVAYQSIMGAVLRTQSSCHFSSQAHN